MKWIKNFKSAIAQIRFALALGRDNRTNEEKDTDDAWNQFDADRVYQKEEKCTNCRGKGCEICDWTGIKG